MLLLRYFGRIISNLNFSSTINFHETINNVICWFYFTWSVSFLIWIEIWFMYGDELRGLCVSIEECLTIYHVNWLAFRWIFPTFSHIASWKYNINDFQLIFQFPSKYSSPIDIFFVQTFRLKIVFENVWT